MLRNNLEIILSTFEKNTLTSIFSIYCPEMTVKSEMSADQSSRVTLRTLHQNFLAPPLGQCMVPKVLLQIPSEIKQV